ncbi:MAG: DUF4956 domain-containing protein [Bacteroidetes bacterium]|nr:DUF4956 domain-containing protein [Bacteroidota bacterium]
MQFLEARLFGIKFIDVDDFLELIIRFGFDFLIIFILIRLIYYPIYKNKDYVITFFLFNILIFFICYLLSSVKLSIGFAFGLFAVFSILRFRTLPISIKEMTYLFLVIGIGVFNAISTKKVSYAELLFTNFGIVLLAYIMEKVWLIRNEESKMVTYEKIDLIKPENEEKLLSDLRERTGLPIHRVEIRRIDFLRDVARMQVFYFNDNETKK